MLASVMGAQGSGKTTVLNEIISRGYQAIERKTSRSILSDWDVCLDEINTTPSLAIKFQDEILRRKIADEQEYVQDQDNVWYTERSYVDLFAYATVSLGHLNEYSDWLNNYFERCKAAQKTYKAVCYIHSGKFTPVHDGVRGSNIHYSRMVDLYMHDVLYQMTSKDVIVEIKETPVNIRADRITANVSKRCF